ncbi:quinon protein alcohol dehydrogenase-like superfamily [Chlamydoabsidia padenii]|nr:quinon protein alcohol dehydrogenase-like superfamily [Chlamydoabsidia padenii]
MDSIPTEDRTAITHVWSLFSSAPKKQRDLILKGILSVCCMPQLSFIYESLQPLLRLDFVTILPRHVNFRIFGYLDAVSLCNAAQVCRAWKSIADDDRLWYRMCDQHIGKTCVKCGWGLSNKIQSGLRSSSHDLQQQAIITDTLTTTQHSPSPTRKRKHSSSSSSSVCGFFSQFPRKKKQAKDKTNLIQLQPDSSSSSITDNFTPPHNNYWKTIYRGRMIVEQNWRQNRFIQRDLGGTKNGVICIQVCDDLQVIMIGYQDNTVQVHYAGDESRRTTMEMKMESTIQCLQFDESKLIVGESNSYISIWDWHQGTKIRSIQGHTGAVMALHFNERNILATGSDDCTIRIWDFNSSQSFVLLGHESPIRSLLLQQEQQQEHRQLLVSAGDDTFIRIWDLTTRQCLHLLTGHYGGILKVIPIPTTATSRLIGLQRDNDNNNNNDRPLILSCSSDNTIRLWDPMTGKCIRTMFGHMDHVTSLACDQFRIVSGSKDKSLRIWSLDTGTCQHVISSEHPVSTVSLSSSGILSASEGVGCIWDYGSSQYDDYVDNDGDLSKKCMT